jgi:hypothetical protein
VRAITKMDPTGFPVGGCHQQNCRRHLSPALPAPAVRKPERFRGGCSFGVRRRCRTLPQVVAGFGCGPNPTRSLVATGGSGRPMRVVARWPELWLGYRAKQFHCLRAGEAGQSPALSRSRRSEPGCVPGFGESECLFGGVAQYTRRGKRDEPVNVADHSGPIRAR